MMSQGEGKKEITQTDQRDTIIPCACVTVAAQQQQRRHTRGQTAAPSAYLPACVKMSLSRFRRQDTGTTAAARKLAT